jgi:hypothetical protein
MRPQIAISCSSNWSEPRFDGIVDLVEGWATEKAEFKENRPPA